MNKIGLYERLDLTKDKRYTLSDAAISTINDVETPIIVDVFLEGDDFPTEFRRLQKETKQLLEEFAMENKLMKFNFINPLEDEANRERTIQQLNQRGLTPMQMELFKNKAKVVKLLFFLGL